MRIALLWILAGSIAASTASLAQQTGEFPAPVPLPAPPQCKAEIEGQLSCQANRLCECIFAQAIPARGLPDRWKWDCSIKRPQCVVTPESLAPHYPVNPDYLVVDHDDGNRKRESDQHDKRENRNKPPY